MDPLRLFLLAGLVAHKALWEWLKRRGPVRAPTADTSSKQRLLWLIKLVILAGLVAQTLLPTGWPPALRLPPVAPWREIGLALFTLGLAVAMAGRWQLGDNWSDIEAAATLDHQRVVDHGVYRWIRHPIYVGDLLLLLGFELALESWLVLGAVALVPPVLRQAVREERMLIATLDGYRAYCRRSKRFVPFVV